MSEQRILIIEDEPDLLRGLALNLKAEGYCVLTASRGDLGLEQALRDRPELVLLDIMLPGMNGLDVCRELRRKGFDAPIIMLTAKAEEVDRVVGLEIGADDYLAKPFEPRELQARLRAILRRKGNPQKAEILRFGRLEIDKGARTVRLDGEERPLTGYQFTLLLTLAERAGRVLTRDALMDLLKGEKLEAFDRSVDVHVSRIRAAIEDDPKKPRRILTVRGTGYVFARDQDR